MRPGYKTYHRQEWVLQSCNLHLELFCELDLHCWWQSILTCILKRHFHCEDLILRSKKALGLALRILWCNHPCKISYSVSCVLNFLQTNKIVLKLKALLFVGVKYSCMNCLQIQCVLFCKKLLSHILFLFSMFLFIFVNSKNSLIFLL